MSAVSCSESIVDIAVGVRCESLHELLLGSFYSSLGSLLLFVAGVLCKSARLSFLLCVVAEVFKEKNLSRLEGSSLGLSLLAVLCKLNRNSEQFAYMSKDVLEGELRVNLLRTSEV